MSVELDQALFGYDRGHRLVASSRKLGKEATWTLRNVTDMKISKRQGHYLTVLPIPEIDVHAFIRTWAAAPMFRPGSVWSHALLVPAAHLDDFDDLGMLAQLFCRPSIDDPRALADLKRAYSKKLQVSPGSATATVTQVDRALLDRIIIASYRAQALDTTEIVVDDVRDLEEIVLGLMSQRWSSLRQRFAARTRYRPSQTSAARFDLEIVERGSGRSEQPPDRNVPDWVVALRSDLQHPDPQLRAFLRAHTTEPDDQPEIVAKVTEVFTAASQSPVSGVEAVTRSFPLATDRVELKRALFGPEPSVQSISATWPLADPERLQLLLSAAPPAVALADYSVADRLTTWAKSAPVDAAVAVIGSNIDSRSEADITELTAGIAQGFDTSWIGKLVGTLPSLAPSLLVGRPDVWSTPEIWTTEIDHRLLVSLVTEADAEIRRRTYVDLLSNGLTGAGGELLDADPTLWWSVVEPGPSHRIVHDSAVIAGSRRLGMAVSSSRGRCPWPLTTPSQAIVIAAVTDPDEGLWRDVGTNLWLQTYELDSVAALEDEHGSVRRDVMALGAALGSDQPAQRRKLWSRVFPRLHKALLGKGTPLGCERTLAALLPHGPSWDWCGRLRYALARTSVTDGWSDAQLREIARGAGDYAHDVLATADSLRHGKDGSFVDDVVEFITGWWR